MIRSFYKYARNRYLWHSLNNFVCEELIWMTFICASMSIKIECYMFKTTNEWEVLTPFPTLLIELFYSFILFSFNFDAKLCQYLSNQIIVHIFILGECYY